MENKTQNLHTRKAFVVYVTFVSIFILLFFFFAGEMSAQYNKCAGQNAVYEDKYDAESRSYKKVKVEADRHGNAEGNQYDLATDGAFQGETVAVLHLYTGEGFDFSLPKAALKEKGFSVYRWINNPPSPEELEKSLKKACQLWIISSNYRKLNEEHLKVIKKFFDSGKGVYIWGDNDPYYADANYVSEYLIGVTMLGNSYGDQVVGLNEKKKGVGLTPGHLITTGLEYVYEGITIATLQDKQQLLEPLIYGHEGNLVTATYEKDGKRLILDGGFTRLYCSWDHAGTGRYVKNAAAWLVNFERFAEAEGLK
jgi:hypothetical protein